MDDFGYDTLMARLAGVRDSLWHKESIGKSRQGREIFLWRGGVGAKKVVYVGAHHGMERLTAGVLADFLLETGEMARRGFAPVVFEKATFYVVPMLNPDGVEICRRGGEFSRWQANAAGVDLNHNYDAGFYAYQKPAAAAGYGKPGPTRYAGPHPESEPETAALCRLLRDLMPALCGVLTLHTQGEEIFCGCETGLAAVCTAIGRRLQTLTGYKLQKPEGLAAYGGLTDWCVEKLRRPAFTLECGRGQNPLPAESEPAIYARLRQALFDFPLFC